MIRIEHLGKTYADTKSTIFSDINCEINNGEVISIIGPSGTGKSTFLRCINMLDRPTEGKIFINDEEITDKDYDLAKLRQKVGMVFQSFNLFENMSAIENVMIPQMKLLGRSKQEAYDKGIALLRRVGMGEKYKSFPENMSGGQKQRVAIARALAMDPEVILFDEPTSALDPTMVGEVEAVINDLAKDNVTMIIVTHEMRFAKAIADRVFFMANGGIYDSGTAEEIFDNPQKQLTKAFVKRLKNLDGRIESQYFDFAKLLADIDTFSFKNLIPKKKASELKIVLEEMLYEVFIPHFADHSVYTVHYEVEYGAADETIAISFSYDGDRFDALEELNTRDSISAMIIREYTAKSRYECIPDEKLSNKIKILLA